MSETTNILDWFKDNIKRISTRALESILRIVYTIPLCEDWDFVNQGPGSSWTCPEGQYEVQVQYDTSNITDNLELNGAYLFDNNAVFPIHWLPLSMLLIDSVLGYISGCTAAEGWKLSTGDTLSMSGGTAFTVRFRRVA